MLCTVSPVPKNDCGTETFDKKKSVVYFVKVFRRGFCKKRNLFSLNYYNN